MHQIRLLPLIWNLIVTTVAIFAAILIPYDLVFSIQGSSFHELSNWIIIGVFISDIFFNIYYHDTFVIVDPFEDSSSVDKYISSFFAFDVIAAIPLGIIFGLPVFQLFHLAKFVKVANLMQRLKHRAIKYSSMLTMLFFLFWMVLSTHIITLVWLLLRGIDFNIDYTTNYIQSLYWCVTTLTTVGYGDVIPVNNIQRIYTIFVMILGVGIYGYVIGNVASIISKKDPAKAQYLENIDKLTALVSYRNLPMDLQKRVQDYYKYMLHKRMGYDENDFLKGLPKSLMTEVSLHLKKGLIENNQLFKNATKEFINEIALKLHYQILLPGDCVFRYGDIGNEMYFVAKGKLSVFSAVENDLIATLAEGSFFGEIALFKDVPRTATIIADTYCDLYSLNKATFDYVVGKYPDIAAKIAFLVTKREKEGST